jgi:hypothetical protein
MHKKQYRAWLKRMKRLFRKAAKPGEYWEIDCTKYYDWMHLYDASGRTVNLIGAWDKQSQCPLKCNMERMIEMDYRYGSEF